MKSQTLISLLTTALLTACGGVYDPNAPPADPTPEALKPGNTPPPAADTPSSNYGVPRRVAQITGVHSQHYYDALTAPFMTRNTPTADGITTAVTDKDDGTIKLRLPNFYASTRQNGLLVYGSLDGKGGVTKQAYLSYKTFQISDSSYKHSQFGLLSTDTGYTNFWRGEAVTKMPTTGQATYLGDSVVGFLNDKGVMERVEQGTARADVDFGRKRLDVSLASPSYQGSASARINYNAKDHEATFRTIYNQPWGITGKFAGENAEEVVGRFVDSKKNVDAAFGAKRQ